MNVDKIIKHLDRIIEKSGEPLEGNCYYPHFAIMNDTIIIQSLANKRINYQRAVSNKKYICEIGFNAGHSLLHMLLVNSNAEYVLFDLGEHSYSKPCLEYIRHLFPNTNIEMFWGDSRITMLDYLSNPDHKTFDCIHIDGGHTPEIFEKDWANSYSLTNDDGIIIFDDTDLPDIGRFVNEQIKKNLVYESRDFLVTQKLEHKVLVKIPQHKRFEKKPVLLWVGDDYRLKTGYGRVAKELFPFLQKDYKLIQYAIGCKGISDEYHIIDSQDGTVFGFNKLPTVINVVKPQIIILLNDSKIIHGWLSSINDTATIDKKCCVIIPYVCTEYIGVPESEVELYNQMCSGLFAMAQFTIDEFDKNGSILKSYRLSHGYSSYIKKMDKSVAKKIMNIPVDSFVFFSGSKNQPRKRLDIIIRAFVHLLTNHADKKLLLLLNCGLIDSGWNLKELYARLCRENNIKNMDKYIYFCSNNIGDSNKNDEELTIIYNASDVGITTSTGESFGLIPFEQSALGVPQIIPNWGGIVEAVPFGSIKVDTNDYYVYPVVLQSCNGEARTVYYKDVANAMERYLLDEFLYKQHCIEVERNIENYSWENIYKEFAGFVDSITTSKNGLLVKEVNIKKDARFMMNLHNDNDFISSYIDKFGVWERNITNHVLDILDAETNKDSIVIDVGANIGYYSLLFASKGFNCYSFEPDPNNFEKLEKSVSINNFKYKIRLYKNAVSNKSNQKLILSTVSGPIVNHGCLTILGGFSDTAGVDCISIKLDDMDELAKPSTAILLMKVDVEGFEPEVIEGANNLLKSGKVKFILIEISPKFRSINDYTKMVLNLVVNHYTIITDCATCEPINYDELICQLQSLPRGQNDYLFELNNEESNKEIIPKKIFQTWHTKELSKQMNESIQLLKKSHPDFQHFLFDIEDCRRFIIENFEKAVIEAYDNLIPYAYKCDLWKYCVLYKFGGIYLDIKYKFCNNFHLNYLINCEHFVLDRLGYAAPNHYTIQNGFIISKPGNPILLDCIENIVKNVQNNFYGFSSLYPTGPGLIGLISEKWKQNKQDFMLKFNDQGTKILYHQLEIMETYDGYYEYDNAPNRTNQLRYWKLWNLRQIYLNFYNRFDLPVYCVHLKKNTDRMVHMINEFKKMEQNKFMDNFSISCEYIEAIDGNQIDFTLPQYKNILTDFAIKKIYAKNKDHGHDLTPGGAGFILTTRKLWYTITKPTLIVEDDITLDLDFTNKMINILAELPNPWDIVYLGYYHNPQIKQVSEYIWTANKVYGLYAYLIHPDYAKKLTDNLFPCNYQLDTEINRINLNSNCFVVYPPIIQHFNTFPTNIQIYDLPRLN